jgi:hypothetical protein
VGGGPLNAGHAHNHVIAEPVYGIIGAGRVDGLYGKVRPLWELGREQTVYEGYICSYFTWLHFS